MSIKQALQLAAFVALVVYTIGDILLIRDILR